jgi:hypothetical protein
LIEVVLLNSGERGKVFTNIPHEHGYLGFEVVTTSEKPLNDYTLKIRISATDPGINPVEVEVIYPAQRMLVEFNPKTIMPGDTANVILKKITEDGSLINFPQDQLFDFRLVGGEHYGTIYVPEWGDTTDEGWYVEQGFKFIGAGEIENLPVESVLMVKTAEGFSGSVQKENKETSNARNLSAYRQLKQKKNARQQITVFNGDIRNDLISKTRMETENNLWGIGKINIGSGNDCSDAPQCDELINPVINFVQIDTSICHEKTDADGITKFYTRKFEEEFNLDACYSQTLNRWQFQIVTPFEYSSEVCYKPDRVYLSDTNQIKTIPYEEICKAQEDFVGFENTKQTKYKILDVIKRHEYLHVEQNINILNDALSATQFYRNISSLTLSCDEINNQQKAVDSALNQFKNDFVATTMEIYRLKKREIEGNQYSKNIEEVQRWIDNENEINEDTEIKNILDLYLDIAIRIKNCIN